MYTSVHIRHVRTRALLPVLCGNRCSGAASHIAQRQFAEGTSYSVLLSGYHFTADNAPPTRNSSQQSLLQANLPGNNIQCHTLSKALLVGTHRSRLVCLRLLINDLSRSAPMWNCSMLIQIDDRCIRHQIACTAKAANLSPCCAEMQQQLLNHIFMAILNAR